MPLVTIFKKWNDWKNSAISDRDGNFKIKVEGDKRNLEIYFVGHYPIKFINIHKSDKTIDFEQIKMVWNHLDDNEVVGGPPSDLYTPEELKERDSILRMNVLKNYRIKILGKNLIP